jgi:predicted metal-dependent HD superfamily phosphohydrolase
MIAFPVKEAQKTNCLYQDCSEDNTTRVYQSASRMNVSSKRHFHFHESDSLIVRDCRTYFIPA